MKSFSKRDCDQLHGEGWLELKNALPEWGLFRSVERYHTKYHARVVELLEATRPTWTQDGVRKRPGTKAAEEVSRALAKEGICVQVAHPSGAEDSDDFTGPRFYVSVMEAAIQRNGVSTPPPPTSLAGLLWPHGCVSKKFRPRITGLGWNVVPPSSGVQLLHADIAPVYGEPLPTSRCGGQGRFHHVMWNADRKGVSGMQVVPAEVDAPSDCIYYAHRESMQAPCVVLDSEMLRCGAATTAGDGWTSTCVVQLCSSEGCQALQSGGKVYQEFLNLGRPLRVSTAVPRAAAEKIRDYLIKNGGTYCVQWDDAEHGVLPTHSDPSQEAPAGVSKKSLKRATSAAANGRKVRARSAGSS